eukprot:TRINITY_DN2626_c0_g1_i1.p1 TRINITY_DN2626_c0_g1~~TRINITY_DN2626_c0_g1_i1.p1  ORF type:complete len:386 (+),score=76.49 TRINITY_DN2626_c0_g1_i1:51-1160(+)
MDGQADGMSNEVLHAVVSRCLKIFTGRVSSTPTASLPTTDEMGLLMFLNIKQAQLGKSTKDIDLYRFPALKPLLSIIEFVNYVVGGLIVEAEKIDEMYLTIKKEMIKREARRDYRRYDESVKRKGEGSQLSQILAVHFPCKPHETVGRRTSRRISSQSGSDTATTMTEEDREEEEDRWMNQQLRQHRRCAALCRTLLHGKAPGGLDPNTASAAASEMGIAPTFRKAIHKVRDALHDVDQVESLPAMSTLIQFMDYLHYGVSVALDELENSELLLRKRAIGVSADRKIAILEQQDKENKKASYCALRFNSMVNSPKKNVRRQVGPQARRVFSVRPDLEQVPHQVGQQQHSEPSYSAAQQPEDLILDAYCC